ncbi:MAG: DUF1569 domain-containing protein [Planctomycetales bacterium]|nr:DUF1569 domain-containing protein [Planctomycetales bacterium]
MTSLRTLQFADLDAAVTDARQLLSDGYERHGKWSLGQICRHLSLVQDPSLDGYPWWMSAFAFLRPAMRRLLLPRLLSGDSPQGIPTSRVFVPPAEVDDAVAVEAFAHSVARFAAHSGRTYPHPAFGRLDRAKLEQLHAAHAAHHLRFLQKRSGAV